jgi:hypothetical protein
MKNIENTKMNEIFKSSPLIKRSFLQRLFNQYPANNAIIAFNNLLANNNILSITNDHIEKIESKYEVGLNSDFQLNMQEFYAVYWNAYLKRNGVDLKAESEAKHLANLLKIDEQTISMLHTKLGEIWYKPAVAKVAERKAITKEDKYELELLRQKFKLREDVADNILDNAKHKVLDKSVDVIIKKNRCSPNDETAINSLLTSLEISTVKRSEINNKIEPLKNYWNLENLPLKEVTPRIALQKSESCFLQIDKVKWYETRNDRYGNKNYELVNQGSVYLTNKRLVFDGSSKTSVIPYDRIRNIGMQQKGMTIYKDKGKDPVLDLSGYSNEFEIILSRVIKEFKGFEFR